MSTAEPKRRFQINPGPLKVVPAQRRQAWEELAEEVALEVPGEWRRKWSRAATARVILADPSESYEELGEELDRTPGAVRYRRQAMIALLRDEHGAPERVENYRADPKAHHKHHDYHQIDELLRELGIYEMPVTEQFALAQPLQQPNASWRGDGTGAVVGGSSDLDALRAEIKRLMQERPSEAADAPSSSNGTH